MNGMMGFWETKGIELGYGSFFSFSYGVFLAVGNIIGWKIMGYEHI